MIANGKELFDKGVPDRSIPPCATCHGANAQGSRIPAARRPARQYVAQQIEYIQRSCEAPVMHGIVKDLTPPKSRRSRPTCNRCNGRASRIGSADSRAIAGDFLAVVVELREAQHVKLPLSSQPGSRTSYRRTAGLGSAARYASVSSSET